MSEFLLAIDCSLRLTNVALARDGEIIADIREDIGRRQAAELPVIVANCVAGIEKKNIAYVAVTNGPGYWTGVRIGMSFAAAFAFGIGAKIVPVGTLEMLLASSDSPSVAVVYAGKNKVYAASKNFFSKIETREYDCEDIFERIKSFDEINLVSDAPEKIDFRRKINAIVPNAADVARIALENLGAAVAPSEIRANWCRSPI